MATQDATSGASVLLAFRAENVRSFRDEFEISLLATNLGEPAFARQVPWRSGGSPVEVLPAAAVFGANASGKSNVLKAMCDMKSFVRSSFKLGDPAGGLSRIPFALDERCNALPSRFEIDIILDGVRFEYGFMIDDSRVLSEWAYRYPKGRAALVFRRDCDEVQLGAAERSKGRAAISVLRPNALFLSTAAATNHPILRPLYEWFGRNLLLADDTSRGARQTLTAKLLESSGSGAQTLALLQAADMGIVGAKPQEVDPEMLERIRRARLVLLGRDDHDAELPEDSPTESFGVRLEHRAGSNVVEFDSLYESLGTQVWLGLIGPVVQVLESGSVFLADELDASLHPALVAQIVRIFQSAETNPNRAQLVFNSHDSSLLGDAVGDRLLGRDQIWFTEKNSDGTTHLHSLADFHPRKQESIAKRYLEGRYGGTPLLSSAEFAGAVVGLEADA